MKYTFSFYIRILHHRFIISYTSYLSLPTHSKDSFYFLSRESNHKSTCTFILIQSNQLNIRNSRYALLQKTNSTIFCLSCFPKQHFATPKRINIRSQLPEHRKPNYFYTPVSQRNNSSTKRETATSHLHYVEDGDSLSFNKTTASVDSLGESRSEFQQEMEIIF